MASRRRSLEEKNLKILRELAAYTANKQCFDCHQRGPTYINMTIGSFVCTSCSGLLRGLTPPHRVKSITMTMFAPEEIEFLKTRGNEYCRHVWLGTYDSRTNNIENDGKDEHRKKDLMVQKYEKKRWYVDPEIAMKRMQQDQLMQQKQAMHTKQYNRLPEVQPLSQLFGKAPAHVMTDNNSQVSEKWPHPVSSASAPQVSQGGLQSSMSFPTQGMHSFDLLPEFGGVSLTSPTSESASITTANGNFANFDSAFNSSHTPARWKRTLPGNKTPKAYAPPPTGWTSFEDELDPLSPASSSHSTLASAMSRVQTCTSVMPRPLSLPTFAPTNPFKTFPVTNSSVNTTTQWMSFAASSGTSSVMSTSASLDAYPSFAQFPKKADVLPPPPPPVPHHASANSEKFMQDRYAALADLDICFNQPSVTSPSWSVKSATTTTNTATTASVFGFSSSEAPAGGLFSTASSNPFAAPTSAPWPAPPTSKPFAAVNPFQSSAEPSLPYQPPQMNCTFAPLPVVGNSPSDDTATTLYNTTNTTGFSTFNAGDMSSPSNGFGTSHFAVQNGEFSTNFNAWGISPSASMPTSFTSSHTLQGAFNTADKRPNDYSNWAQNPFMAGSNVAQNPPAIPKSNSNNPFL